MIWLWVFKSSIKIGVLGWIEVFEEFLKLLVVCEKGIMLGSKNFWIFFNWVLMWYLLGNVRDEWKDFYKIE